MHARGAVATTALLAALAGCTSGPSAPEAAPAGSSPPSPSLPSPSLPSPSPPSPSATATVTATATASQPAGESTAPATSTRPARFSSRRAVRHVRVLAGRIGPRLATSPSYRRAAAYVAGELERHGYAVRRQPFPVPAGDSWGVPAAAGRSFNVVAEPAGFDPASPHLLVGAHLDTVAVAPGAEDNASGVSVLLELARLAAREPTRLPVVLVAFGAEEPRGPGDALHHFGSQHLVRELTAAGRRSLRAMASLDRVGVGGLVPVCTGGLGSTRVRDQLLRTARAEGIAAAGCTDNRASDHWSFEKAGFDVARLGSTPYAGYHSADDVPAVVQPAQLDRTGRLVWAWLRADRSPR